MDLYNGDGYIPPYASDPVMRAVAACASKIDPAEAIRRVCKAGPVNIVMSWLEMPAKINRVLMVIAVLLLVFVGLKVFEMRRALF